jgi:hypothetical protein
MGHEPGDHPLRQEAMTVSDNELHTRAAICGTGILLHLVPHAVARLIRLKGDAVYRMSVVRTQWHHYNVRVRTNPCRKELRPACTVLQGYGVEDGMAGSLPAVTEGSRRCVA